MKRITSATVALLALVALAFGATTRQPDAPPPPAQPTPAASIRFLAFDLYIDPHGQPLAAYQVEITSEAGPITTLVGIEGGDGVYSHAPYYDPEALHSQTAPGDEDIDWEGPGREVQAPTAPPTSDRVILAALAADGTGPNAAAAPASESRVARLHYMLEGDGQPALTARLIVAGVDEHTPIDALVRLVPVPIADP